MLPISSDPPMKTCIELAKNHMKDSQNMRNKILWSHETKIEHYGIVTCPIQSQQNKILPHSAYFFLLLSSFRFVIILALELS